MARPNLMQAINDRYGRRIWSAARRYASGRLDPEDIFHDILIAATLEIRRGNLTLADERRMHSCIITTAIDSCRHELTQYRPRQRIAGADPDQWPNRRQDPHRQAAREEELRGIVMRYLPLREATIILELAFPGPQTLAIAARHQANAQRRRDGGEANVMNAKDCRVMAKHVAESLGAVYTSITPRTVSAARRLARDLLLPRLDPEGA